MKIVEKSETVNVARRERNGERRKKEIVWHW